MAPAALKHGSRPPWIGLAAAVWVQLAAACGYCFPLYSHSLKSVLGFTQQQLTMLGVANDAGENFGLLAGVACNRFPPSLVLLIGAACCFLGFGTLWLAVSRTVAGLPYWLLWIALCIATNSSAWFSTGVLVTNMRNFPLSRGTVAGILKGYSGITAAVYTGLYAGLLHGSSAKLLLFLTLGLPAISLAMMYFVRCCTPSLEEDSTEQCHFLFTQISSVALGLYLIAFTVLSDKVQLSDAMNVVFLSVMILLLMAPLAIPLKMTLFPSRKTATLSTDAAASSPDKDDSDKAEPLLTSSSTSFLGSLAEDDSSDVDILLAMGEGAVKKKRKPKRGDDFEFHEALVKADFWLLFVVFFFGAGSGVTVLNNLAQIGIAAGVNDTTILLSAFSFCNFLGRLGGGAVSEHFCKSKMLPRSLWMTLTQIVMVGVCILYALGINGTLYVSTALLGICYGAQYSVMVPMVSELFGLKHFGLLYNFIVLGNPFGALLFSSLAGYLYDQEAARQFPGIDDSTVSCYGPNCFRLVFLILAGVCGFGTLLSMILTARIKPVYQMLYSGGSFRHPRGSQDLH